jgi:tyrosine-protein kinase Etk/Wzc
MTTESVPLDKNEAVSITPGVTVVEVKSADDELSFLDLLIVLAERKRIVFTVTAVFAILAIIISLILPKTYTGTLTLLPPQEAGSMSSSLSSQLGGVAALLGSGLGMKNSLDMYVAMFKSRSVESGMVNRYDLQQEYHTRFMSDACKAFESHVKVDATGKDGLIHISVYDGDPRRAAELANGYVEQFRLLSQHLAISEASQRRLFFEQELAKAKDNLANAEEAMKKTELKTGVMQVDMQARALSESASTLRGQIAAKKVMIQGMETYATGENSQLVQAQTELQSLRSQLAAVGGSEDTPGSELVIPKGKVPEAGLEYLRKARDVKYYETIFEILARQFEAAKLDEAKQGALIQVVDPAVVPDLRSSPKRGLIVVVATFFGFIFGVFAALINAAYQHLKTDPASESKIEHFWRALSLRRRRA